MSRPRRGHRGVLEPAAVDAVADDDALELQLAPQLHLVGHVGHVLAAVALARDPERVPKPSSSPFRAAF